MLIQISPSQCPPERGVTTSKSKNPYPSESCCAAVTTSPHFAGGGEGPATSGNRQLLYHTLSQLNRAFEPLPNSLSAPCSPVELGRINTQFCHAESRPKIFVSSVSSPANRKLASSPVSASGDKDARSSIAIRISSSQSRSSGVTVTRPSSSACSGPRATLACASSSADFAGSPSKRVLSRLRSFTSGSS